jgi:eukaryotic-like serine/threonine-protein kinase
MTATISCIKCHTPIPADSKFCLACGADVTDPTGAGAAGRPSGPAKPIPADDLADRLKRVVQGKYQVKQLLGRGGMGAVFLAHDITLEREVAIKMLPPEMSHDTQLVGRFQREAKTAAKLDHPNIIPIYRVESEGGLNYFVMKYVPGRSLEDVLENEGPLPVDFVRSVLWEAAVALGHAHQRGVVHRDIKPANIMLDEHGRVVLTDFGISKAVQAATQFTGTGMIIGTPHYMSPEQGKGAPVDGRADQYSLAVLGYRMLAGHLPFSGDSVHTILYKHIFEEAAPLKSVRADVPENISEAIAKAMGKDPAVRYGTMEAFATGLWPERPAAIPAGGGTPVPAGTGGPRTPTPAQMAAASAATVAGGATSPLPKTARPPRPPAKKSRAGLFVGLAVVAVLGVGGVVLMQGGGTQGTGSNPGTQPVTNPPRPESTASQTTPPVTRQDPPRQQQRPPRQTTPPRNDPAPEQVAMLTVSADPYGTVFIDNVNVGDTPTTIRVTMGRHTIRVEREGYKTRSETITVDGPNPIRKRYVLEPEGSQ